MSAARAGPQQQSRQPTMLLSIDGTDRRTDGRTLDRFITLAAHYADSAIALHKASLSFEKEEVSI